MEKPVRLQKEGKPFVSETRDPYLKHSVTFLGRRYGTLEFRVTFWSDSGASTGRHIQIPASQRSHMIGYQRFVIVNIERDSVDMIPQELNPNAI